MNHHFLFLGYTQKKKSQLSPSLTHWRCHWLRYNKAHSRGLHGFSSRVLPRQINDGCLIHQQCQNYEKCLQVQRTCPVSVSRQFHMLTGPLFQINLHLLSTVSLNGFQSSRGAFKYTLSKAVSGKFHGSGGHCKHNCLQGRANFHRSQSLQIVLIFTLHQAFTALSTLTVVFLWFLHSLLKKDASDLAYLKFGGMQLGYGNWMSLKGFHMSDWENKQRTRLGLSLGTLGDSFINRVSDQGMHK